MTVLLQGTPKKETPSHKNSTGIKVTKNIHVICIYIFNIYSIYTKFTKQGSINVKPQETK